MIRPQAVTQVNVYNPAVPTVADEPREVTSFAGVAGRIERLLAQTWEPWREAAVRAEGGFHEEFGPDHLPRPSSNATLVGQSRHLWAAATVSQVVGDDGSHPAIVAGVERLREEFWDPARRMFRWRIGEPDDSDVRQESVLYGAAFALFALSAASRAIATDEIVAARNEAADSLRCHHFDPEFGGFFEISRPGVGPVLDPDFLSPIGVPPTMKGQNATLHTLEALTELQLAHPDGDDRLLRGAFEWLAHRTWEAPFEGGARIAPRATRAGEPLPGPASYGHDVQAAHLLRAAGAVLREPAEPLRRSTRALVEPARRRMAESRDGLAVFTDSGDPDGPRTWWVAAEALLTFGTLALGGEGCVPEFLATLDFVESRFRDPEHGGWHERVAADGTPLPGDKGGPWKSPYHDLRAALELSRLLQNRP